MIGNNQKHHGSGHEEDTDEYGYNDASARMKKHILQSNERRKVMARWIYILLTVVAAAMVAFLYILSTDK